MSKAVILAPTPPPAGGIAGWTVRMMSADLKNGWEIAVVDEKLSGKREVFGDKTGKNFFVEIKRCFRIWRDLWRALNDKDAQVVHSCIPAFTASMMREYVCAKITRLRKRKFIVHFRCTVPNTAKGRGANFMLRHLCKNCDRIMVLNRASNEYLRRITSKPIYIIPNFIDEKEIVSEKLIKDEIKTVLYVGGVTEDKGCIDLVRVASQLPQIEFRLVGEPEQAVVDAAAGISNVVFTGAKSRTAVKDEMNNADVFIFLSHYYGEGFSNALAEAMASGLPCIVTDWASNADMIEDGIGGFVVPCSDTDMTVYSLKKMSDKSVRRNFSAFNIEKVKKCYSDKTVVDEYVDCYESCIQG